MWESIVATFDPKSRLSGIHPISAMFLIEQAIHKHWTVSDLACQLQADHDTNDAESATNHKAGSVCKIFDLVDRHKEIVFGAVSFLDINGHCLKTYRSGDDRRSSKQHRDRSAKRNDATDAHMEKLDETMITNFFKPLIYDVGVENLDVQVYLRKCRPHWLNKYREDLGGNEDIFSLPRAAITPTNLPEESEDDDK
jgi:hypothetical protein